MKLLKISIFEATDGEVVSGTITKQLKKGESWVVEQIIPYVTTDAKEHVFLLEDNQRIVVEGTANKQIIYDHSQAAARPITPPRVRPTTPPDKDADESPRTPAHELAQTGSTFLAALEQERRDRLISEARQRFKESQKTAPKET